MNKIQIINDDNEKLLEDDVKAAMAVYIKNDDMDIGTFIAANTGKEAAFLVFSMIVNLMELAYPKNPDDVVDEDDKLRQISVRSGLHIASKYIEENYPKVKFEIPEGTDDEDDTDNDFRRITLHD